MNLIFTHTQLEPCPRYLRLSISAGLGRALLQVEWPETFQQILNDVEISLIIAKAATYCLQYVCDVAPTKQEAGRHLDIGERNRRKRKLLPWQWHRRDSPRNFSQKQLLSEVFHYLYNQKRYCYFLRLFNYGALSRRPDLAHKSIYSPDSFDWTLWNSNEARPAQLWHQFLSPLEYIITLLPRAGRYEPLIHLCRTKTFAPMSMMFPDISRRARRAIAAYLERMDSSEILNEEDRFGAKT